MNDQYSNWTKEKAITKSSEFNHSYVRKVIDGRSPFIFFWADGNPNEFSKSQLYFGDLDGNVFRLPYIMKDDFIEIMQVLQEEHLNLLLLKYLPGP